MGFLDDIVKSVSTSISPRLAGYNKMLADFSKEMNLNVGKAPMDELHGASAMVLDKAEGVWNNRTLKIDTIYIYYFLQNWVGYALTSLGGKRAVAAKLLTPGLGTLRVGVLTPGEENLYTYIRASHKPITFDLLIFPKNILSSVSKLLSGIEGFVNITTGKKEFDDKFIIWTTNSAKAKKVFDQKTIQKIISLDLPSYQDVVIGTNDNECYFYIYLVMDDKQKVKNVIDVLYDISAALEKA